MGDLPILTRIYRTLKHLGDWLAHSHGQTISVLALLTAQATLLAYSATANSPTRLEPALLAAGVSHWELGRFDLYCVNPPLVRMVAALPIVFLDHRTDWSCYDESPFRRPEFCVGRKFVQANGLRSRWLFTVARWSCIPFALLGGLMCFFWARSLWGPKAGLFALALWCFEPNILGHGSLITNDVPATATGLVASFAFVKWMASQSSDAAVLAGLALAAAVLTKMTWLFLFALWPVFVLIQLLRPGLHNRYSLLLQSLLIPIVSILTINLAYGMSGTTTSIDSFHFRSLGLATLQSAINDIGLNWFPALLPREFIIGLDTQAVDLEAFPVDAYMHGIWLPDGSIWYYFYAALFKVPLGLSLITLLAVGLGVYQLRSSFSANRPDRCFDQMVLIVTPMVLGVILSWHTEINEHFRYAIPCLGFLIIGGSYVAVVRSQPIRLAGLLSLIFVITSSLSNFPHSLAYFNELAGGAANGHRYLLGSNLDWEQDLYRLADYYRSRANQKLWLVYEGAINPNDLGLSCQEVREPDFKSWVSSGTRIPLAEGDLLAVRVNSLVSAGCHDLKLKIPKSTYTLSPETVCGRTLLVYSLSKTK